MWMQMEFHLQIEWSLFRMIVYGIQSKGDQGKTGRG